VPCSTIQKPVSNALLFGVLYTLCRFWKLCDCLLLWGIYIIFGYICLQKKVIRREPSLSV